MIVELKDIVDALEMQFDEYLSYLNLDTGRVETVSREFLGAAEEGEEEPELLTWQEGEWEIAKRIASTDRYLHLPTKFDVHEWEIMQNFSLSVESEKIRHDLLRAIHGGGAFRRFKDTIHRHEIESAWYAFRSEALSQIAIEWLEENQIPWK